MYIVKLFLKTSFFLVKIHNVNIYKKERTRCHASKRWIKYVAVSYTILHLHSQIVYIYEMIVFKSLFLNGK